MISEHSSWNTHYKIFDSVEEVLEQCQTAPLGTRTWKEPKRVGELFSSWQQVLSKARQPNPTVTDAVREMIEELEDADIPQPMIHKRMPKYREDEGDELDIDRLRNAQAYWRTCERMATVGAEVKTIIINMSTRIGVSHNDIHWRGAAAIALCHLLEDAGYRVEIWAVHVCSKAYTSKFGHCHAVRLKEAYGELDVDTISTVVSGWFYRSVWFKLKDRNDGSKLVAGAGSPRHLYKQDMEALSGEIDPSASEDIVVLEQVFSKHNALWQVKQYLKMYAEPELEEDDEDEMEEVQVAQPASPPPTMTKAEQRKQEAEWRRWQKEWAKKNREA